MSEKYTNEKRYICVHQTRNMVKKKKKKPQLSDQKRGQYGRYSILKAFEYRPNSAAVILIKTLIFQPTTYFLLQTQNL